MPHGHGEVGLRSPAFRRTDDAEISRTLGVRSAPRRDCGLSRGRESCGGTWARSSEPPDDERRAPGRRAVDPLPYEGTVVARHLDACLPAADGWRIRRLFELVEAEPVPERGEAYGRMSGAASPPPAGAAAARWRLVFAPRAWRLRSARGDRARGIPRRRISRGPEPAGRDGLANPGTVLLVTCAITGALGDRLIELSTPRRRGRAESDRAARGSSSRNGSTADRRRRRAGSLESSRISNACCWSVSRRVTRIDGEPGSLRRKARRRGAFKIRVLARGA